jgi:hypothetical protein
MAGLQQHELQRRLKAILASRLDFDQIWRWEIRATGAWADMMPQRGTSNGGNSAAWLYLP